MIDERQHVGFVYTLEHVGVDGKVKSVEKVKNLMPLLGVNYLLGTAFVSTSQYATWYVSLYGANVTPATGDTMTSFIAACEENTVYTTTAGARLTITFPAVTNGTLVTTASPNEFDFPSASTVRGAFITSHVTRGGTSGLLVSAVLFPSPKVMAAGETLRVPLGFALVSV